MKRKIIFIAGLFMVVLFASAGALYFLTAPKNTEDIREQQIVAVNEIEQLALNGELEKMSEKSAHLRENIRNYENAYASESIRISENIFSGSSPVFIIFGICGVFIIIVFSYVYFAILRPFDKMKHFAEKISQGDFDVPLDYERSNYFGEFTWAFDSMRREITKARANEREAVENNKTVIATISHDIKTPIASIRVYAEGLEANMDSSPEKRRRYLDVIMRKCDEVSRLTNDLFIHSLSNLDKLKIESCPVELCGFLENVIGELSGEQNDIVYIKPDFSAVVSADKKRLTQIAENLINNSLKYAKSRVDVSVTKSENSVSVHFRDYGSGIPSEDMPFICNKFYRGKNCGDEQGSGLGLYIVEYIVKKLHGEMQLYNRAQGLEVVVSLPLISSESQVLNEAEVSSRQ